MANCTSMIRAASWWEFRADPKYTMRAWINLMDGLLGEDRIDDDEIPNPVYAFLATLVPLADENGDAIRPWSNMLQNTTPTYE